MSYYHINNLYKDQSILRFKECYALEKIHGMSARISYKDGKVSFFVGGEKHENFIKLFNEESLIGRFKNLVYSDEPIYIYGEAYGGKCQGMSATYGNELKFVAFEVKIGHSWLSVPQAERFAIDLGLDFVYYKLIPSTLEAIDAERDANSVQAIKNGMGEGKKREGIVLRPIEEVTRNNGERIIAKHKRDEFKETATSRSIEDKLEKLTEIRAIVDEWVTRERLNHIITSGEVQLAVENIGTIVKLMVEDIYREGKGEIQESKDLDKTIGRTTALMVKEIIKSKLYG